MSCPFAFGSRRSIGAVSHRYRISDWRGCSSIGRILSIGALVPSTGLSWLSSENVVLSTFLEAPLHRILRFVLKVRVSDIVDILPLHCPVDRLLWSTDTSAGVADTLHRYLASSRKGSALLCIGDVTVEADCVLSGLLEKCV